MNWLKIVGIILIVSAGYEILHIISDYSSGKLEFCPFGVESGAGLMIWLGIFLIKGGTGKRPNSNNAVDEEDSTNPRCPTDKGNRSMLLTTGAVVLTIFEDSDLHRQF